MRLETIVAMPWQPVLRQLLAGIGERGLSVRRTFDLRKARQALRNGREAPCPLHGSRRCTCQYLVLQIGGRGTSTSALVVHGYDRRTKIALLSAAGEKLQREVAAAVCQAFEHSFPSGRRARNAGRESVPSA